MVSNQSSSAQAVTFETDELGGSGPGAPQHDADQPARHGDAEGRGAPGRLEARHQGRRRPRRGGVGRQGRASRPRTSCCTVRPPASTASWRLTALVEPAAAVAKDASQQVFEARLLADKQTSSAIKQLMQQRPRRLRRQRASSSSTSPTTSATTRPARASGALGRRRGHPLLDRQLRKNGTLRRSSAVRACARRPGLRRVRTSPDNAGDELCCPARITQSTLAGADIAACASRARDVRPRPRPSAGGPSPRPARAA